MKNILSILLTFMLVFAGTSALGEAAVIPDDVASFAMDLWSGEMDDAIYARFSGAMKEQISLEQLSQLVPQLTSLGGQFISVGDMTSQNMGEGQTLYVQRIYMETQDLMLQLVVDKDGMLAGLGVTPAMATSTPEPQTENETEISIGENDPLPGILRLPQGQTSFPAVVLVHGSGPNDRNETVGKTALFQDIAKAFDDAGIATLRYDKRTYVYGSQYTQEQMKTFTVEEETIQDAIAAAKLLKETQGVEKVYLLGHSMGAMLGPRIVQEADGLFDGMILVAGTPKTLLEIMIAQNQAAVDGLDGEVKVSQQAMLDDIVKESERIFALSVEEIKNEIVFGQPAYYYYEMNQHDAASILKELTVPTFIINGAKDFQVTPENGYNAWLPQVEGLVNVTLKEYENLNHVLMAYTGEAAYQGSVYEYNTPATLDEGAAQDMIDWIKANE